MITNYHAHTYRCLHTTGTEEDYVQAAIQNGYSIFGFADHCPWNYGDTFTSTMRMKEDQIPDYVSTIRQVADRYADQIQVLCGLECEYFPKRMGWLRDLKEQSGLDYLILGNHFDFDEPDGMYFGSCTSGADLNLYVKRAGEALHTGLYSYFAHPDLCFRSYSVFNQDCKKASREICACAIELGLPLEYNLSGLIAQKLGVFEGLGYPYDGFWEVVAEEGAKAIIGVDAHSVEHVSNMDAYREAQRTLARLGVSVVDTIG